MPGQESSFREFCRAMVPKPVRALCWSAARVRRRRRLLSGREHEPAMSAALKGLIHPGDVCLDIGANVGILSVLMAHRVGPEGRVFAFEACPENEAPLRANLRLCGMAPRVEVVMAAAGDGSIRELKLYPGRRRSSSEWNVVGHDADGHPTQPAYTVPAVALDDYFPSPQRIDAVKIDVEGAEAQVLAGMRRIIRDWSPRMIIECHSPENYRACAELCAMGYRLIGLDGRVLDPAADYPASHFIARTDRAASARAA